MVYYCLTHIIHHYIRLSNIATIFGQYHDVCCDYAYIYHLLHNVAIPYYSLLLFLVWLVWLIEDKNLDSRKFWRSGGTDMGLIFPYGSSDSLEVFGSIGFHMEQE